MAPDRSQGTLGFHVLKSNSVIATLKIHRTSLGGTACLTPSLPIADVTIKSDEYTTYHIDPLEEALT